MPAPAETDHRLPSPDQLLTPDAWGIRPIATVVEVRGVPIESLNPSFLHMLHRAVVEDVDGSYVDYGTRQDGQPQVDVLFPIETSAQMQERYIRMLVELGRDPRTVFVGPLYGVYDTLGELKRRGIPHEQIIPGVFDTGTSGTQTATQVGFRPLVADHPAWRDPSVRIVGVEDVIDSGTSQLSILEHALRQRKEIAAAADVRELITFIKYHRTYDNRENFLPYTHPILRKIYRQGEQLADAARFVYAAMFIKNPSVSASIRDTIHRSNGQESSQTTSRREIQAQALATMVGIPETQWIVGLSMDTKVRGFHPPDSDKPHIMHDIRDPRVQEYLRANGMEHISLRTLSKLPYLGWFRGNVAELTAYTARKVEERVLRNVFTDVAGRGETVYSFGQI